LDQSGLSQSQIELKNSLSALAEFSSVDIVAINQIEQTLTEGDINLGIETLLGCDPYLVLQTVDVYENGDTHYLGEAIEQRTEEGEIICTCNSGQFSLYTSDSTVSGYIQVDEEFFEIKDIGGGKNLLGRRDFFATSGSCGLNQDEENDDGDHGEGSEDSGCIAGKNGQNTLSSRSACHPVRVLFLYDALALSYDPIIEVTARRLLAEIANYSRWSGVWIGDLSFEFAGVERFNGYTPTFNILTDVIFLDGNATVQQRRQNARADIVVFLTDNTFSRGRRGIASAAVDPSMYVALIDLGVTNSAVAAHEVGHLIGCRHEIDTDATGPFEHAYEFKTGCWPTRDKNRTLLWNDYSQITLLRYSNSDRKFKKEATGTSIENNALKLSLNGCIVADHDPNNGPPIIQGYIEGENLICTCTQTTFTAQSNMTSGQVTYEWRQSSDGVNYGSVISTNQSISITASCSQGITTYLRVDISDANGSTVRTTKSLLTHPYPPSEPFGCPQLILFPEKSIESYVYPTINDGSFRLIVPENEDFPNVFTVTSSAGEVVFQGPGDLGIDLNTFDFKLKDLPPGYYVISFNTDTALKFIIHD